MMLLKTPLNTSYECSLESQIHLMKVDNVSMYLRVIKVNQLQAFSFSNDSNTSMLNCASLIINGSNMFFFSIKF